MTISNATNLLFHAINNLVERVQPDSWQSDTCEGGAILYYKNLGSLYAKGSRVWIEELGFQFGEPIISAELAHIIMKKAYRYAEDARRKEEQALASTRMKVVEVIHAIIDSRTTPLPAPETAKAFVRVAGEMVQESSLTPQQP